MNKTQNYQLNQWEAEDKVQRVDFNADNAKIDAAIKAVDARVDGKADQTALAAEIQAREALSADVAGLEDRSAMHYIKTVTLEADAASFIVPLNDIDWGQWMRVYIYLKPQGEHCFTLTFGTTKTTVGLYPPEVYLLLLFPTHRPYLRASGIFFIGGGTILIGSNHKYQDLPNLYLSCWDSGTVLKAGTAIEIYGEK